MQVELDALIQESIYYLMKLLKTSEPGMSSSALAAINESDLEIYTQNNKYSRGNNTQIAHKGKLTEKLLSQGLLTPSMLQELQKEWTQNGSASEYTQCIM
ncbi:ATP-dependent RNA helicase SUV3 homolog, mitochondrial [Copidosoma floridanum]|uniref:ATP-dependent RNA helicase SUV3 homolog, mitochondrial n=1 Tax=Copidosoma floridanum TaxID=29053 RepID=UPI0006C9A76F|nr:ATP-dependent RNA helicase SUV3 homolog, mitochondrial [Copidosoma floridanum]